MASIDPLSQPFASWQEGLLALAEALPDPSREKIIVARLEATTIKKSVSLKEICALALLVPSRAGLNRQTLLKNQSPITRGLLRRV